MHETAKLQTQNEERDSRPKPCLVKLFSPVRETIFIQNFNYTLVTFIKEGCRLQLKLRIKIVSLTGEKTLTKHHRLIVYHASTMTFSKHISQVA